MLKFLSPFILSGCINATSDKSQIIDIENINDKKVVLLENITTISINSATKAPISFFYLDIFDNMGIITKNNTIPTQKIERTIIGNENIILKYSLTKQVVPFILFPGDSIEIDFNEKLIPLVTFSKFGNEKLYNIFSSITQSGGTLFSSSNYFLSHPRDVNIDSLYKNDSIRLKEVISTDSFSSKYLTICKTYLYSQYILQKWQRDRKIIDEDFLKNDFNLQFHTFRDLLGDIEFVKNSSATKNEGNLMIKYFNSALSHTGEIKNYLLFYTIKWMKSKNRNLFEKYKKDFIKNCSNKEYVSQITTEINIGSKSDFYSFNDSSRISFEYFLKVNKGKIIYIDVWASWCAPCRASLASSIDLHNKYNNKPIAFAYFSIDANALAWQKAVKEEKMQSFVNNFIITNSEENNFIKAFKISSIPRYIVYNKSGKLIDENASNPNSPEFNTLISKLLLK